MFSSMLGLICVLMLVYKCEGLVDCPGSQCVCIKITGLVVCNDKQLRTVPPLPTDITDTANILKLRNNRFVGITLERKRWPMLHEVDLTGNALINCSDVETLRTWVDVLAPQCVTENSTWGDIDSPHENVTTSTMQIPTSTTSTIPKLTSPTIRTTTVRSTTTTTLVTSSSRSSSRTTVWSSISTTYTEMDTNEETRSIIVVSVVLGCIIFALILGIMIICGVMINCCKQGYQRCCFSVCRWWARRCRNRARTSPPASYELEERGASADTSDSRGDADSHIYEVPVCVGGVEDVPIPIRSHDASGSSLSVFSMPQQRKSRKED